MVCCVELRSSLSVKGVTLTRTASRLTAARPLRRVARALRQPWRSAAAGVLVCVTSILLAACSAAFPKTLEAGGPWQAGVGDGPPAASTLMPSTAMSVLTSTAPDALTVAVAGRLFSSAPVVVVAADTGKALSAAKKAAVAAHAPLLLSTATVSAQLLTEIRHLRARDVLAVGLAAAKLSPRLPGVHVVTRAAKLPPTGAATAQLNGVVILVNRAATTQWAVSASTTTAEVAGAMV